MKHFRRIAMQIMIVCVVICGMFVPNLGTADDLDHLRDYPHPIICKPILERDGMEIIADKDKWIVLEWSEFLVIGNNRLLFKHNGKIKAVPMEGFRCGQ